MRIGRIVPAHNILLETATFFCSFGRDHKLMLLPWGLNSTRTACMWVMHTHGLVQAWGYPSDCRFS